MNIQSTNLSHLGRHQKTLSQAIDALSSGLRINRAADDAGGLSISSRLDANVISLKQVNKNINDGISLLQTIEGALEAHQTIAGRMRELLVQANSETYSQDDKGLIRIELVDLRREYERIARTTNFNRTDLMGENPTVISLQIGQDNNADNRLEIDLNNLYSFRDIADHLTVLRGNNGIGFISPGSGVEQFNDQNTYNPDGFDNKITDGLGEVKALFKSITDRRAIVGALQNQLESALSSNKELELNLTSASSGIKDIDYAVHTSRVTSAQLSFDASYSSMVQAKDLSSDILGLL